MRNEILKLLETDSRLTVKDIAAMIGADEAAVEADIKAMEDESIICGYHTMIDWDKVGEEMVTPQREAGFDQIADRVRNFDEVHSVYLIAGAYDFMVVIQGKTLREISHFVSEKLAIIEDVIATSTNFVLKKYKDYGRVLDAEEKDERMLMTP